MTQITLPNQSITGANLWSQVEQNDQAIADVVNGMVPSVSEKTDDYTPVTADAGKILTVNKATAVTITVDGGLDLDAGERIDFIQTGAGQVTFSASGTTVNGSPGLKISGQYRAATLVCVASDSYILIGSLAA